MPQPLLRCALVGHGNVAGVWARALAQSSLGRLIAVCGRDRARTAAFATAHGISHHTDVGEMVRSRGVEVVIVATPHPSHAELALAAIHAGVNVLVEKPMATTVADCDRLLAAAARAGVTLGTVSQRRFYPAVRRLHDAISGGRLGRPILASVTVLGWRSDAYYEGDPWRGTWAGEGGGLLVNQLVHYLDLLGWLCGPFEEVFGYWSNATHPRIEVDDTTVAVARGADGLLAAICASNSINPGLYGGIRVHGETGASIGARIDGAEMFVAGVSPTVDVPITDVWTIDDGNSLADLQADDRAAFATDDPIVHYHRLQLDDFLLAIRDGRVPMVTATDGRRAVQLVEGVYASMRTGRPQRMHDPDFRDGLA